MSTQPTRAPETSAAGTAGRQPLVLTLRLAEPAQSAVQALRNRHFPAGRNLVPAHVSLFHALPGIAREPITHLMRGLCERHPDRRRIELMVQPPRSLGRGVAFPLASAGLAALHAQLAQTWWPWLSDQDRQPFRPHVTVQNKVTPDEARRTLALLARGFVPFRTEAAALLLWRYCDGPWELLETLPLAPPPGHGLDRHRAAKPSRTPGASTREAPAEPETRS